VDDFLREGNNYLGALDDIFDVPDTVQETAVRRYHYRNRPDNEDSALLWGNLGQADVFEGRVQTASGSGRVGDLLSARPVNWGQFGELVYLSTIEPAGNQAICLNSEHDLVWEGMSLSPTLPGTAIDRLYHPATGQTASSANFERLLFFSAGMVGPSIDAGNDSVLFRQFPQPGGGANRQVVAREGTQVPGRSIGVLFGDVGTDNVIGGGFRSVLFNAPLVGTGIDDSKDWALVGWSPAANNVRIVAQEGQHVEGLPAGAVLTDLTGSNFQLNEFGRAIFNAPFDGSGGDGLGMFWADPDALPRTIVYTGQDFDVGGGVLRTISDIGLMELAGAMDGRGSQINSAGTIVVTLDFTDGSSGVFAVQVPEPGAIVLATLALVGLATTVRRRRPIR
jgi:hypothetical protein